MLDAAHGGLQGNIWDAETFTICAAGWNERAKELNVRYRETVGHWNIAGRLRNGPLAGLRCRAQAAFRH